MLKYIMLYNGRFKKTFARIYNKIIYLNFCKTSISSPSSSSFIPVSHAQHVCQVFSFLSCIAVHSKRCIVLHINIYNKTYIVWSLCMSVCWSRLNRSICCLVCGLGELQWTCLLPQKMDFYRVILGHAHTRPRSISSASFAFELATSVICNGLNMLSKLFQIETANSFSCLLNWKLAK